VAKASAENISIPSLSTASKGDDMRLDEYDRSAVNLANEAYGKIVKFHYNREFTTPKQKPPEGFLYHYTTADGLKGIIENDELWAEIVGFKSESFAVDKEWRVVIRQRVLMKQGTDDSGKTPTQVYFRSSRGALVPYVKLIPTNPGEKQPIYFVRTGPTLEANAATLALPPFLQTKGYPGVRIRRSDISVRI
jgi:hypothetical protein